MKISFECSIDIDDNRKIWMEGSADIDPDKTDQLAEAAEHISKAVAESALDTYTEYDSRQPKAVTMSGGVMPPAMPPTFQDDSED